MGLAKVESENMLVTGAILLQQQQQPRLMLDENKLTFSKRTSALMVLGYRKRKEKRWEKKCIFILTLLILWLKTVRLEVSVAAPVWGGELCDLTSRTAATLFTGRVKHAGWCVRVKFSCTHTGQLLKNIYSRRWFVSRESFHQNDLLKKRFNQYPFSRMLQFRQ